MLRRALAARVAAKRAYIVGRGVDPVHALDPRCFDRVGEDARAAFFRRAGDAAPARAPLPAFQFTYKLG